MAVLMVTGYAQGPLCQMITEYGVNSHAHDALPTTGKMRCTKGLKWPPWNTADFHTTVVAPSPYQQVLRTIHQHLVSQFSPSQSCHPSLPSLQNRWGQHHRRHRDHRSNHRRHRRHPSQLHHHSPNLGTHQLLFNFDIVNPSRASGSISFPGLFRRRAQRSFQGWVPQHLVTQFSPF